MNLAALLGDGVNADDIELDVTASSVRVVARIHPATPAAAAAALEALEQLSTSTNATAVLSAALNVPVEECVSPSRFSDFWVVPSLDFLLPLLVYLACS